jgi:DNA processing protein
MDEDLLKKFTLNLLQQPGIGSRTVINLVEEAGGINILWGTHKFEKRYDRIKPQLIEAQKLKCDIFDSLEKFGVGYKCFWEDDYPLLLKQIADPPAVLFFKGSWSSNIFKSIFTIVGTRNITSYGKKWVKILGSDLGSRGYAIASGMAMGVDREAHIAALEVNAPTIAVLGTSVHEASPKINRDVYERILNSNGLVISEIPPGVEVRPGFFATRNRILAGLSLGTIIVEAAKKSGSLITGNLAFEYSRLVFALPGNVSNKYSEGCNSLIKNGVAKLIENTEDILVELGHTIEGKENKLIDRTLKLEENEKVVYNCLLSEPKLIEEISVICQKDVSSILSICTHLELKGIIYKNEKGQMCLV